MPVLQNKEDERSGDKESGRLDTQRNIPNLRTYCLKEG